MPFFDFLLQFCPFFDLLLDLPLLGFICFPFFLAFKPLLHQHILFDLPKELLISDEFLSDSFSLFADLIHFVFHELELLGTLFDDADMPVLYLSCDFADAVADAFPKVDIHARMSSKQVAEVCLGRG
jgi:hypothetical protein